MLLKINDLFDENFPDNIMNSSENIITLDLLNAEELSIGEINRILLIKKLCNKTVEFINSSLFFDQEYLSNLKSR